jgi:iron complex outermembrane receptor protein
MTIFSSQDNSAIDSQVAEPDAQPVFTRSTLAMAVVAALSPGMSAYAQGPDESLALEEVIVTATKRSLNLQDVPQSINTFTGDELQRMGVKNMNDYVKALPSVTINRTTPGRNQLVMRGISTGSNEYRTDSQVAVYLDELAMTTNSQQVSPRTIDMERLESLPGPQGTLFGSSSQTGTLRLITNKPNYDGFSAVVEGGYGTIEGGDDSYDFNGFANFFS